jgi:hypothetical protein
MKLAAMRLWLRALQAADPDCPHLTPETLIASG